MVENPDPGRFDCDDNEGHDLNDEAVYGPLESRRYGHVIGINPLPGNEKLCAFNCVYCQLGWTPHQDLKGYRHATVEEMEAGLRVILPEDGLKGIVICGNGEPTRHEAFAEMVTALRAVRDELAPDVPLICLTNGEMLLDPPINAALSLLDECAVKLDVGSYDALRRVNLPRTDVDLKELAKGICDLGAVVQTCLFEGILSNTSDEDLSAWHGALRAARPSRVDCYTISRPPATWRIHPVDSDRLVEIAQAARADTGLDVRACI